MEVQQALKGFILKPISILNIMAADHGVQVKMADDGFGSEFKKKKKKKKKRLRTIIT